MATHTIDTLTHYAKHSTKLKHASDKSIERIVKAALRTSDPPGYIERQASELFGVADPVKQPMPERDMPNGRVAICPRNNKHRARVYTTRGRIRYCVCDDCDVQPWKQYKDETEPAETPPTEPAETPRTKRTRGARQD